MDLSRSTFDLDSLAALLLGFIPEYSYKATSVTSENRTLSSIALFLSAIFNSSDSENVSDISGHEDIKWTLQKAIENEEPIHILHVGPPGLGKTRFLKAIEEEGVQALA